MTGPFEDLLAENYWEPSGYGYLHYFNMSNGTVSDLVYYSTMVNYALIAQPGVTAVNTGLGADPASPVSEPATMLLMGTGLAGFIGARRKKKA